MRLTQEYQLIEHYDEQASRFKRDKLDAYIANITTNTSTDSASNDKTTSSSSSSTTAAAAAVTETKPTSILQRYGFNRIKNNNVPTTAAMTTTSNSSPSSSPSSDVFVLSMGHRIQFLQFSPTGVSREIIVTIIYDLNCLL